MIIKDLVENVYLGAQNTVKGIAKLGENATNMTMNVARTLTKSEQRFGDDLGKSLYLATGGENEIAKITSDNMYAGHYLVAAAKKTSDPIRRRQLLQKAADSYKNAGLTSESILGAIKTNKQYLGDAAGVLVDILASGTYGKAASGMQSFKLGEALPTAVGGITEGVGIIKSAIQGAKTLAPAGALIGGAQGVTSAMQENESTKNIGLQGVYGTATGAIVGGVTGSVFGGISGGIKKYIETSKRIYDESITGMKKMYDNYDIDMSKGVPDDLVTGRIDDVAQKLDREGYIDLATSFRTQLEGQKFSTYQQLEDSTKKVLDSFGKSASAYEEAGNLTTNILKKLEGGTTVSKQFIADLTNSPALKQQEKNIIRNVLSGEKTSTISVNDFATKVKQKLLDEFLNNSIYGKINQ